jgi:polyphenol oxidase
LATESNYYQPMSWFCEELAGLKKYRSAALNYPSIVQAFSSKDYGNMALHTGDLPAKVIENRQRFLNSLGLELANLVAAEQVHGTVVQVVDRQKVGCGAWTVQTSLTGTDALITRERGVILSIFTADCLPIFIYDPQTPAIGIVHAGWRGTIAQIAKLTIHKMVREFKTDPGNCMVTIGPSICANCFKVSVDVAEQFRVVNPRVVIQKESDYQVDLGAFNAYLFQEVGIKPEQISITDLCTTGCHGEGFFSYRAEGGTMGRMMGIIALQ